MAFSHSLYYFVSMVQARDTIQVHILRVHSLQTGKNIVEQMHH